MFFVTFLCTFSSVAYVLLQNELNQSDFMFLKIKSVMTLFLNDLGKHHKVPAAS